MTFQEGAYTPPAAQCRATDAATEVEEALALLRPAMEADGGGVQLVSVDGGIVHVRLRGTCVYCPSNKLTLLHGIEPHLRELLPWVEHVYRVP